jgi:nitrite reductase (NADH) small subunit
LIAELPADAPFVFTTEEHKILIWKVGDRIAACDSACPHAGGPLEDGYLHDTTLVCPWHGWAFDLATGSENDDGLKRFPVKVENGAVWVDC